MPQTAPDFGYGERSFTRVTDPDLEPARSWTIPTESVVDGLVEVDDEDALGPDGRPAPPNYSYGRAAVGDDGYAGQTVKQLESEIDARNAGREESEQVSKTGNKSDLVKALEADDSKEN